MPQSKPGIQTDLIVEIESEVEPLKDPSIPDISRPKMVGRSDFDYLFRLRHPQSDENPRIIWNALFGNHYEVQARENLEVRYLTTESCGQIIEHYHLFKSGIDFQHLPRGFFLIKNDRDGGIRNILHYNQHVADIDKHKKPLSIVLSVKPEPPEKHADHGFSFPKSKWYEFLLSKISDKEAPYCTEKELNDAFAAFSRTLAYLELEFGDASLETFRKKFQERSFNPIVLLGRWNTALTLPQLKRSDAKAQWQALPHLEFAESYGAIRAITDYQNTAQPCAFLVPEMFSDKTGWFDAIRPNGALFLRDTKSAQGFWRYLAYQPQRNSIEFYRKGMDVIQLMNLEEKQKIIMRRIFIASTTGGSHTAKSPEDAAKKESLELQKWRDLCYLVDNITSVSLTMQAAAKAGEGEEQAIKERFIANIERLKVYPNIYFLGSIIECIQTHIKSLSFITAVNAARKGEEPLPALVALSDHLDSVVNQFGDDFYEGARFYFDNHKWKALDVEQYIHLQHALNDKSPDTAAIIVPYVSTFNIRKLSDAQSIMKLLSNTTTVHDKNIAFCLKFFRDIPEQQKPNVLIKLIDGVKSLAPYTPTLELLKYVANNFSKLFPQGYFEKKENELLLAEKGLDVQQKQRIEALLLPEKLTEAVIQISSHLLVKNRNISRAEINTLPELFVRLNSQFGEFDCAEFAQRLASMKLSGSVQELSKLLTLLSERRSLEGFNQIFFCNTVEKCVDDSLITKLNLFIEVIKPLGTKQGSISSQSIQDLLARIVLNFSPQSLTLNGPSLANKNIPYILYVLKSISEAHPHIQHHLLAAFTQIPDKNTDKYFSNVLDFVHCIDSIALILPAGNDASAKKNMLTFFALMANFHEDPADLVAKWEQISALAPDQQLFFLTLINSLKGNKQSFDGFEALVKKVSGSKSAYKMLSEHCANPPYPELTRMVKWLSENNFEENYQQFSKKPYGERHLEFGFKRQEFAVQKAQFIGIKPALFTDTLAEAIDKQIKANRELAVPELRKAFLELQAPLNEEQKLKLLCLCIEMLARTTAQWHGTPPQRISQELNTTQIMALYVMLTHPGKKLISEIYTGEGKSRIMMILAACQVAQGKTVDFMTSDMPLAERDYLEYNAFFTALNIRSSLISLSTPQQLYQKGGINFSDSSQLLLLRNKSDIHLEPFAYLNQDLTQRCLLADEIDKFKHDRSKDSYNFASQSPTLKGFVWIYPLLVKFVQKKLKEKVPFNAKLLTDELVAFIPEEDTDEQHQGQVAELNAKNKNQLITWINAAYTALHMQRDGVYKVTLDKDSHLFAVRDAEGYLRRTRKIIVLDNGRPVEGSAFSGGVQQCLCAIENQIAGKEAFIIPPENVTLRRSYPVSFLSQYEEGAIFGVSGTTRMEGPSAHPEINYENYNYLRVPRHKVLRREDKNIWLAKDEKQQIQFIKRNLMEKLNAKPQWPVLLICKDDNESKALHRALESDETLKKLLKKVTLVDGATEKPAEKAAIAEAGTPGYLTISTAGMFSRGVDIHADKLLVLCSYVPTIEDEIQIKGRTGRFGKPGEYRMIPNLSDASAPLNGKTPNIQNEVLKLQKRMALSAVYFEEITKAYAVFLEKVHTAFFANLTPENHEAYMGAWIKYLADVEKDWGNQKQPLLDAIESSNYDAFIEQFKKFAKTWVEQAPGFITNIRATTNETLTPVYKALKKQQVFFKHKETGFKAQAQYDVSDDGQARAYSSLFAQERAILRGERPLFADFHAWSEGRGALFPDLMATLRGERPLFANLRETIADLIEKIKAWLATKDSPGNESQAPDVALSEKKLLGPK